MKLAELFSGHSGLNVKREYPPETGNKNIVYLGTDAIARGHSAPTEPLPPTKERRRLRIRGVGRLSGKQWHKIWGEKGGQQGGETLWLDNPTSTRCSSCGY